MVTLRNYGTLWFAVLLLGSLLCAPSATYAGEVKEIIDGVEWTTNKDFPPMGNPKATKGGTFRKVIYNAMPTLRFMGPDSSLTVNQDSFELTHDSLLKLHPDTLEYIPRLASHWRDVLNEDGTHTYWFKSDPRARFSDGSEVTAEEDEVISKM